MGDKRQVITGGTFHGPVINVVDAQRIENSFNSFAKSNPEEDLKSAVEKLHQDVAQLIEATASDEAKDKVVSDLESFAQETAKSKPNETVLAATARGLIAAAKTVGEMVEPVTNAVKGVLGILGLVGLV